MCFSWMLFTITSFTLALAMSWNWSRWKLFVSSLLHSLMWTGAGTRVAKGKGWIKLSLWVALSTYCELKWQCNLGLSDSLHPLLFHVIKPYLSVFSLLFVFILWLKVALKKKDSGNPQYAVFSVAPQMTLLSLLDSAVMKQYTSKSI